MLYFVPRFPKRDYHCLPSSNEYQSFIISSVIASRYDLSVSLYPDLVASGPSEHYSNQLLFPLLYLNLISRTEYSIWRSGIMLMLSLNALYARFIGSVPSPVDDVDDTTALIV
jgi:hypothetical protein